MSFLLNQFSTIKGKLLVLTMGTAIISTICISLLFCYNMINEKQRQSAVFRQEMTDRIMMELKNETQMAAMIAEDAYKQQQAGTLTEEQAKKQAADIIRNLRYDDGKGYFWIDTDQGVNVVLLGSPSEGKSRIDLVDPNGRYFIKEMIENGLKEGGGYTELMFAKPNETTPLPKINYTMSFKPWHWVMGTGVWVDNIDAMVAEQEAVSEAALRESIINVTIITVLLLLVFLGVAIWASRMISRPIIEVEKHLKVMAGGDFHQDIPTVLLSAGGEIGSMGNGLKILKNNMHDLLSQVNGSAQMVAAASEQLTSSAEQSSLVSQQVAKSISEVAGACTDQFNSVEQATNNLHRLAKNMEVFRKNIDESNSNAVRTKEQAEAGNYEAKGAVNQMEAIEQAVGSSAEVIMSLGERSQQIGSIVDTISTISGQTTLLALNAAIEAARAGDQGRGFAVVAEEVRKLAEESNVAAQKIAELIDSVQSESNHAVEAMKLGQERVQSGTDAVVHAGNSFGEIADMVISITNQMEGIQKVVHEVNDNMTSLEKSIDAINSMSRSVAAESETVSAATEEQTASMQEIANASESLATMAQELQDSISRFKL